MQYLLGRPLKHDLPFGDDHDAVTQCRHFLHDVRGEQHAFSLRTQAANQLAHAAGGHDVEAVGRLIEQHRLRVVDQRARDGDLHAFALGIALRRAVCKVAQTEFLYECFGAH